MLLTPQHRQESRFKKISFVLALHISARKFKPSANNFFRIVLTNEKKNKVEKPGNTCHIELREDRLIISFGFGGCRTFRDF